MEGWANASVVIGSGEAAELHRIRSVDPSGTVLRIGPSPNPNPHPNSNPSQNPNSSAIPSPSPSQVLRIGRPTERAHTAQPGLRGQQPHSPRTPRAHRAAL